jgi:hypothetical protein
MSFRVWPAFTIASSQSWLTSPLKPTERANLVLMMLVLQLCHMKTV